jgi:small-conductance mechanosensitive channel
MLDLPDWILGMPSWAWLCIALCAGLVAGFVAHALLGFVIPRLESVPGTTMLRLVLRRIAASASVIAGLAGFVVLLPATGYPAAVQIGFVRAAIVAGTLAIGLAAYRLAQLGFDIYARRHDGIDLSSDVHVRRRQTRLNLLRRLATVTVAVATVSIVFMSIPALRAVGVSLFASAGVAGIAIGLAARPAITNLLAGIQIAFTEPIRIGDQVVLEGEWGTVEDITSTYVVVNIWDQRRLILPLSYFLEKPFQNWTRESPQLLGTSMFYVDYSVPVEEMRQQLTRILRDTKLWDGRACALQVTDLRENTVEIRPLMSARNAGSAFELRCHVREKMIEWLRAEYPLALPRTGFAVDRMVLLVPVIGGQNGGGEEALVGRD